MCSTVNSLICSSNSFGFQDLDRLPQSFPIQIIQMSAGEAQFLAQLASVR